MTETINNYTPKSEFLKVMMERGFIHQCTDPEALDKRMLPTPIFLISGCDFHLKEWFLIQIVLMFSSVPLLIVFFPKHVKQDRNKVIRQDQKTKNFGSFTKVKSSAMVSSFPSCSSSKSEKDSDSGSVRLGRHKW